ncbi:hypothetical protein NHX12_018226 [Muraenolepis orangiensis]|uniref:C-type lectin domain-containing protein n=1 Tax=Muraenolepis orangiensis TaxID=630683 RepID=A0A9Q0EWG3_9TELE|nr:hypothetical protein NHX12_018226 [Muraenolepis orangiensis]
MHGQERKAVCMECEYKDPSALCNRPEDGSDLQDYCLDLGASLVSIHSRAENLYLKDLMNVPGHSDVWIGAFYLQSRWRWIDNSGMYYSDWIGLSTPTSASCGYLRSTKGWANSVCSTNRRFICVAKFGSC